MERIYQESEESEELVVYDEPVTVTRKWNRWEDLMDSVMSPERQARVQERVIAELREDELRELRRIAGLVEESSIGSNLDQRLLRIKDHEDGLLSLLRRYVEELGGELEVVAVIGNHRVHLQTV